MWEEPEEVEGEDDEEEDEGLAGQLLSDLIASNKYGTSVSPVHQLFLYYVFISTFMNICPLFQVTNRFPNIPFFLLCHYR